MKTLETMLFLIATVAVFFFGFMLINLYLIYAVFPEAINSTGLLIVTVSLLSILDVFVWGSIGNKIGVLCFGEDGDD